MRKTLLAGILMAAAVTVTSVPTLLMTVDSAAATARGNPNTPPPPPPPPPPPELPPPDPGVPEVGMVDPGINPCLDNANAPGCGGPSMAIQVGAGPDCTVGFDRPLPPECRRRFFD